MFAPGESPDGLHGDTGIRRTPGARGDDQSRGGEFLELPDGDLVVPENPDLLRPGEDAHHLEDVVGEGVVVVDED